MENYEYSILYLYLLNFQSFLFVIYKNFICICMFLMDEFVAYLSAGYHIYGFTKMFGEDIIES